MVDSPFYQSVTIILKKSLRSCCPASSALVSSDCHNLSAANNVDILPLFRREKEFCWLWLSRHELHPSTITHLNLATLIILLLSSSTEMAHRLRDLVASGSLSRPPSPSESKSMTSSTRLAKTALSREPAPRSSRHSSAASLHSSPSSKGSR